jgi:hypothetical protein
MLSEVRLWKYSSIYFNSDDWVLRYYYKGMLGWYKSYDLLFAFVPDAT